MWSHEGREPERRVLVAAAPDLDRIDPAGLREAAQQPGDVADVIGVQVREEDLGRGLHRESQRVEVREGTRAQVEEEEVLLGVADLDEQRSRRLAASDPRVTAAKDRDADLAGGQGLRSRHEGRVVRSGTACRPQGLSKAASRCPRGRVRGARRPSPSFLDLLGDRSKLKLAREGKPGAPDK